MVLIADEPPRTRPRRIGSVELVTGWPGGIPPVMAGDSHRDIHACGSAASAGGAAAPSSSKSTDARGSSERRAASTHPAVPPPTTTKSKLSTSGSSFRECEYRKEMPAKEGDHVLGTR